MGRCLILMCTYFRCFIILHILLILFVIHSKDDIRMISDATVEKEESHAGKVLLRSWYERNKHIFPASRWEPYDPTKVYDKYTIKDKCKK